MEARKSFLKKEGGGRKVRREEGEREREKGWSVEEGGGSKY